MTDLPTPETEAAILASEGQWSSVLKECCEKLERERNQLREIVEQRLLAGWKSSENGIFNPNKETMIHSTQGDILRDDSEAIVNTVNCVGVMGRGIALQFRNAYPENYKAYEKACQRDEVQPGKMFVYETGELTNPRYIINFPTKRHWRGKSRMEDIDSGLNALVQILREKQIRSIAIPPLGSGLGGLDWAEVRPRIVAALGGLDDVKVTIYEPAGAPIPDSLLQSINDGPKTRCRSI